MNEQFWWQIKSIFIVFIVPKQFGHLPYRFASAVSGFRPKASLSLCRHESTEIVVASAINSYDVIECEQFATGLY